ncbi:MAG: hypothetical protein AB7P08_01360 [Burkholderiales bacterium]
MHELANEFESRLAAAADDRARLAVLVEKADFLAGAFRPREGLQVVREALTLGRALGDGISRARALSAATLCHYHRGDFASAVATGLDAVAAFPDAELTGTSRAWRGIALALAAVEDFGAAQAAAERALRLAVDSGDAACEASARAVLGIAFSGEQRFDDARRQLRAAAGAYRRIADRLHVKKMASNIGHVHCREADVRERQGRGEAARRGRRHALRLFRAALALGTSDADDAIILGRLGECEHRLGRFGAAREHLARSLALAEAVGSARILASVLLWWGFALDAAGDPQDALSAWERASRHAERVEDHEVLALCLEATAGLEARLGRAQSAQELADRARQVDAERRERIARLRLQVRPLWDRAWTRAPSP